MQTKTSCKLLQFERTLESFVDKKRNKVLAVGEILCTHTMYTICSYVYLCKKLGVDIAWKILAEDNTLEYIHECLNQVPDIEGLTENSNWDAVQCSLMNYIDDYKSPNSKKKKNYDIILVVTTLAGLDFENLERYVKEYV